MRMCRIDNLDYPAFEVIRDAIYSVIPFAVIEVQYSKNLRTGYFNFWDSDYIPDEMKEFIVQPPMSRENKELLHERLGAVIDAWKKGQTFAEID